MSDFNLYLPIVKIDKENRTVAGYATTEAVDKQGEIVSYDASKAAFADWQTIGNIREMHEPIAVGKAIEIIPDDEKKAVYVKAMISKGAEDTWQKVKDGVLKGFSIGGNTLDKTVQIIKDADTHQDRQITRITKYRLNELSLVDNPANPESTFTLVKRADDGRLCTTDVLERVAQIEKSTTGGESNDMDATIAKELTGKIDSLVEQIGKLLKQWEDTNPVVGGAKKAPNDKATEKADMTAPAAGVQTQDPKGSYPAKGPIAGSEDTKAEDVNATVGNAKGDPNAKATEKGEATGDTEKVDMTKPDTDPETQDPKGSYPAKGPVKAMPAALTAALKDKEDAADGGADEDTEDAPVKTAKSTEATDLRKVVAELQAKVEKLEKEPLPRKYAKVEKSYAGEETPAVDAIQKDYDEVHAWIKGNPGKDLPAELAAKRERVLNKMIDRKFGGDLRK